MMSQHRLLETSPNGTPILQRKKGAHRDECPYGYESPGMLVTWRLLIEMSPFGWSHGSINWVLDGVRSISFHISKSPSGWNARHTRRLVCCHSRQCLIHAEAMQNKGTTMEQPWNSHATDVTVMEIVFGCFWGPRDFHGASKVISTKPWRKSSQSAGSNGVRPKEPWVCSSLCIA